MAAQSLRTRLGTTASQPTSLSAPWGTQKGYGMYFQSVSVTPQMGFTEAVNAVLSQWCNDSPYSGGGMVTKANLEWIKEQAYPFIGYAYGGWGSGYPYIAGPLSAEDAPRLAELVSVLHGLSDYPLIDDDIYFRLEWKIVTEWLTEFASEHAIDADLFVEFYSQEGLDRVTVESDHSPYCSDIGQRELLSDFQKWDRDRLARIHGQVELSMSGEVN